jgi:hypothetical protein
MAHRPRKRNWYLLVASILIVTTISVPLAKLILPSVHRYLTLNQLTSPDPQTRAHAQTYFIRMADRDPEVLQGAIARLNVEDRKVFMELVVTIDQAGKWTREIIPIDPWVRWLGHVAEDADAEERIRAAQLLADLHDHAAHAQIPLILSRLASDGDPAVRYNAMVCAAELSGAPDAGDNASTYQEIIYKFGNDEPMIARHRWLFIGLMSGNAHVPFSQADLRNADIAEAALWAALRNGKDVPPAALAALNDATSPPRVRAMAAYALGLNGSPAAREALIAFIDQGPRAVTDDNQVAFWRAILSLPLAPRKGQPLPGAAPPAAEDAGYAALLRFLSSCRREDYENVSLRPLVLACLFRDRWLLVDAGIKKSDIITIADDPVAWLAQVEGVPRAVEQKRGAGMTIAPPPDAHEQVRMAILRAAVEPKSEDFLPLLLSEKSAVRDQACILAAGRLPTEQVAALVRRLMKPLDKRDPFAPVYRYDDSAKRSAAILAGLTGVEADLLLRMAGDFEHRRGVIEIIQLGLWMQHQRIAGAPDMAARAAQLLYRDDLPASTVLLALLHRKSPAALDYLLTPRGDQNPRLLKLLDEDRWWFVLDHFLPQDAPRLWVWADNDLARFQLDLLRDWYVLNRRKQHAPTAPSR